MLHALPAVLDDLERRLILGEDPMPLLNGLQWQNLIEWPKDLQEARHLKTRLAQISMLIQGLHAPMRATLMAFNESPAYQPNGEMSLPDGLSTRLQAKV